MAAVYADDVKTVEAHLQSGADPNYSFSSMKLFAEEHRWETFPLLEADSLDMIGLLLRHGADPDKERDVCRDVGVSDVRLEATGEKESFRSCHPWPEIEALIQNFGR